MRPLFVLVAFLALFSTPAARADVVAPDSGFFGPGIVLNTIFRRDARQYQQFIGRNNFPQQLLPQLITGLQVRLDPNAAPTVIWPANDVTFPSYVVTIGTASFALTQSGGVFDPTLPFSANMVNPVTVRSGPLTIKAGSYVSGFSAPVIPFNLANYQIQPGQYLVVYVNHSNSDQNAGAANPGFFTVSALATTGGYSSAVIATNSTGTMWNSTANSPYELNFVSGPLTTNLSTRGFVGTGAEIMIGGFIISGTTPKKVIIRALGPSIGVPPFNVPNVLANPSIVLFKAGTPNPIATNDDWETLSAADKQTLADNNRTPGFPTESALVMTLAPGAYTPQVIGVGGTTGNALVEVYDIDPLSASTLTNISTRAAVGTVDNVTIGGFIVTGDNSTILIRGRGPSLGVPPFNVPGVLADPTLQLYDSTGQLVTQNDNWQTQLAGNGTPAAITATGLAPTYGKESAILLPLKAGAYTCIMRGKNDTTGIGLIEVFQIPQ